MFKFATANEVTATMKVKAVMKDNSYVIIPKDTTIKLSDLKRFESDSEGIIFVDKILTPEEMQVISKDNTWLNAFLHYFMPKDFLNCQYVKITHAKYPEHLFVEPVK